VALISEGTVSPLPAKTSHDKDAHASSS